MSARASTAVTGIAARIPKGMIYYGPHGEMAVQIAPRRRAQARRRGDDAGRGLGRAEGLHRLFRHLHGRREGRHGDHHRDDNLQPGEGGDLVRRYEFVGDRLVLRPPIRPWKSPGNGSSERTIGQGAPDRLMAPYRLDGRRQAAAGTGRQPQGHHHLRCPRLHGLPDRARPRRRRAGDKPTGDEAKAALDGHVAYFGTYSLDERARTVTHHRHGSVQPGD